MADFETLATKYPFSEDGDPYAGRDAKAQQAIRAAYMALRKGRASTDQVDMILVDLAKFSGYYNTTQPPFDAATLAFCEGQRSIFGRMLRFMNPPASELDDLQRAVTEEMKRDGETGLEIS